VKKKSIPDYIEPIAILAIGKPEFVPPRPERMNISELLMKNPSS
jgi:hypothetical protein